MQPKKPKAEAQPRTPYVPKQAKVSGQKRQASGQKQHGKGKKQKKSGLAEAAVEADAEEAPPLPPPDSLSAYDSSQTMVEAGMEDDDSLPVPPLPPPSPDTYKVPAAVVNGNSSSPQQSASGPLAPAPEPPEAPSAPQGKTQFGFKLQASKRQKLKMTEAEEPVTHGMRERLEKHLALQQQQQQQEKQQQQQLPQQVAQVQPDMQLQGGLQAPPGSLPLPGPPPGPVIPPSGTHQLPFAAVYAAPDQPVNGLPPNARHGRHGQSHVTVEEQRHASHRQHKHLRQHAADESASLVTNLEPDLHPLPQQLPGQLHPAEPELPPGLAPELDQSSQQSPQQLQRRLSHRHVHHRRSRRLHRTDQDPPQQHAEPVLLPEDVQHIRQPEHQQPGFGLGALPEQPTMHRGSNHSAQQLSSQDAQPTHQLPAQMPDQHEARVQNGPQNGPQSGFGGLAESGGPVAVASNLVGASNEVQVLADDVKSLLR